MPRSLQFAIIGCVGVLAVTTGGLRPRLARAVPAGSAVDYQRQIRPILSEYCFACHGPDAKQRKAKLRLDVKASARRVLSPDKPADSELLLRVTSHDDSERMPPAKSGKKLAPEQIALLKRWVEQGAPWSEHWAFVPPKQAPEPTVSNPAWVRSPIDAFILARLDKAGLKPSPPADKVTLIRRVTLDLTGLPPTPAEVDAFLNDSSPDAYEKVVDRLLASPRYGEHVARYWLDAARYGDTHGLHLDNYREIWPYREWVINAFNHNLPYDQFVIQQLAGDLLPNPTLDQIIATGFTRCHVSSSEGGAIEEEFYVRNVDDRVDTFGTVYLGLTVGCCRCHDHKYDPIRTKDYYQLFAFFNSIDGKPLDLNAAQYPPNVRVPSPEQAAALKRLDERLATARQALTAEAKKANAGIDGRGLKRLQSTLTVLVRTWVTFRPLLKQVRATERQRAQLEKQIPVTLVFRELKKPRPAYVLTRGEYDRKGEKVGRNTPAFLPPLPADFPRNRLGLARWLVRPEQPLTARVAVNRLWQQCFGTGIVKTAEDFGSQGEPPSLPELLDWLAVQFMADHWDVKRMMKRLVTSSTYRQSSRVTPERLAKDPGDRLLSRGPRYRMDAEVIRDQALFVSGLLVEHEGGASVKPPQPSGLWEAVGYTASNTARFTADVGAAKVHRRSMYTFWKRTSPPPQMTTLDAPSREACTVRRERTNTPLQALLLLNEQQFVECARGLAERALKHDGTPEGRAVYLFRLAAARKPEAQELAVLLAEYREQLAVYSKSPAAAQKLIAVGTTKPDAKLPPAELAAWTVVANTVLNLDEVLNKE